MKYSRYINIDSNTLLEYIYDDGNLIGEPYNILYNTQTKFRCFVSTDELVPPIKGYKQTNNDAYNQLYPVGQNVYSRLPSIGANQISDLYPSLQFKNFSLSIPVRYDKLRIHIPTNYTFGDMKGFYIRVYAFDYNNEKIIELTNYHFNITDVEQNYKLEFSSPALYISENQWGKYLEVQIPSVTKISDQRINDVTRNNSINYNLTDGLGLSKTSPIFIEFRNIESITKINGSDFYNLTSAKTLVVPQTPEFEKLGIKIEESKQGDFFLIYGIYNGNLAEFQTFINESFYQGLRYRVSYIVDIFEETIKTKTYTFSITEDINEEIEFRPILKYTTTTAIIDVTLRLINIIDDTFVERKASYGLLQGGGQRMGAQSNGKLTAGNYSGGGGDISKYASSLTKINLRKAKKPEVINYKSIVQAAVGSDAFGTKAILILEKLNFVLYSKYHNVIDDLSTHQVNNVVYVGNNQLKIDIDPFDNLFKFKIYKFVDDEYISYNLTDLTDIKLTMKGDKKDLDFNPYRDTAQNDFENGVIIFKIPEGSYKDIKKLSSKGYNLFYINGIDVLSNRQIVYSGFFTPYDSKLNVEKLETEFQNNLSVSPIVFQSLPRNDDTNSVLNALDNNTNNANSVNTSTTSATDNINFSTMFLTFDPRYRAADLSIATGLAVQRNSFRAVGRSYKQITDDLLGWREPRQGDNLTDLLNNSGIVIRGLEKAQKDVRVFTTTDIAEYGGSPLFEKYLLGYFKGLNIFPNNEVLTTWKSNSIYFNDLKAYIDSKKFTYLELIAGEFLPTSALDKAYFDQSKVPAFYTAPIIKPAPVPSKSPASSGGSGQSAGNFGLEFGGAASGESTGTSDVPLSGYGENVDFVQKDFGFQTKMSTFHQIQEGDSNTKYTPGSRRLDFNTVVRKGKDITSEVDSRGDRKILEITQAMVNNCSNLEVIFSGSFENGHKKANESTGVLFTYHNVTRVIKNIVDSKTKYFNNGNEIAMYDDGIDRNYITFFIESSNKDTSGSITALNFQLKLELVQEMVGLKFFLSSYNSDTANTFILADATITGIPTYRTKTLFGGVGAAFESNNPQNRTEARFRNFKGIIRDSNSIPIMGVQITLSSINSLFTTKTISTTAEGKFDFGSYYLVVGEIKLRMLKAGYVTKEIEINDSAEALALFTEEGGEQFGKIIGITMTKN